MEKVYRQMKFYWKMIKPEKSELKDNSQEFHETNSQGGVEENEEDDTISEKKDENEAKEREGSADGSEDEDSDEEIKDKDQIDGHIQKKHRMNTLIKYSLQKKVLNKKSQNLGQNE
jgi:hypothetical protein